jgi:hypothetical protein
MVWGLNAKVPLSRLSPRCPPPAAQNLEIHVIDVGYGLEGFPYHRSIWQQEVSVFGHIPRNAILDWMK